MIRFALFGAAALLALAVGGCSFTPVYGENHPMGQMSLAFDLGSPDSRIEQVIYEEMALRFATTTAPNTPELNIDATARTDTRTTMAAGTPVIGIDPATGKPRKVSQIGEGKVTVTAVATATYNGKVIFTATRMATAGYSTSSTQALADRSAEQDAQERAAKAAAESLRLAILATFPKHESYLR